ncbi:NIPSNAP family protein [Robiginitalea aurantiaca]|uniref:NIPSNAP family protein n=1 Tax=Robiginitalea aurantiaca TaxID=3056915 RepID=A0ABT7WDN7_9FLAO|nr:NIPSNAP family protein [Robiginitalea aurantiaca]MDM9631035.1 NIPSNAP family protein [Robiginitalea aurantiaca]
MFRRLFLIVLFGFLLNSSFGQSQIYELRVYELDFFRPAEVLHTYLEKALIPALNRQGIKHVGAFEEAGDALPKKLYLLIAYDNMGAYGTVTDALRKDSNYLSAAEPYFEAPEEKIAYNRYESSFIRSVVGFPDLLKPAEDSELFELRIYESHNEDALRRKVKMFNDSEFKIFEEVGLPMVFFGENISGHQMPCLTYLLAFKDKAGHEEAWSKFGPHPEWQRITKLEEYANSMNDITRVFLKPLPYSQL